jgi:hypothetical protein
MSIEDPDLIDAIGIDGETGDVILSICDHLEWQGLHEKHAALLGEKIRHYIKFIMSGQLAGESSNGTDQHIRIEIVQKHAPDAQGQEWLVAAKQELQKKGHFLSWRIPGTWNGG